MKLTDERLESRAREASVTIYQAIAATGELDIEISLTAIRKAVAEAYEIGVQDARS
jgi:hypothetical protein